MRKTPDCQNMLRGSDLSGRTSTDTSRIRGLRLPVTCIVLGIAVLYFSERSIASLFVSDQPQPSGLAIIEALASPAVRNWWSGTTLATEDTSSSKPFPGDVPPQPKASQLSTGQSNAVGKIVSGAPETKSGVAANTSSAAWLDRSSRSSPGAIGTTERGFSSGMIRPSAKVEVRPSGSAPQAASRTINWDADNPIGNFSLNNNWFGDVQPTWGSDADLHFTYRNNSSQTSLYDDYNSWRDINDIFFDSTYGQSTPINGDGNSGLNFNQRVENDSPYAQTINIPLSGAKFGAAQIELNPVTADLTIGGSIFNDNNKPYYVYGTNGKTLTLNTALAGNSSVTFNIIQNSNVVFGAANTYSGNTFVNAGKLQFATGGSANNSVIRIGDSTSTAAAEVDLLPATGGLTLSSVFNPRAGSSGTATISSQNTSGTNTLSNQIALDKNLTITQAAGGTLNITQSRASSSSTTTGNDIKGFNETINNAGTVVVSGDIYNSVNSGTLTLTGGGSFTLSGANTFSGGASLLNGTLILTTSSSPSSGFPTSGPVGTGTFHLGSGTNPVTLQTNQAIAGPGTPSDIRTLSNSMSLDGDATFSTSQASGEIALGQLSGGIALTRTNQLTVNANVFLDFFGVISGGGFGLTKLGPGTLSIGGSAFPNDASSNTYSGLTTISGGTLALNKNSGITAIAGNILVDTSGTLRIPNGGEQIKDTASLTVNTGGTFSIPFATETIAALTVGGGSVAATSGSLIIAGAGNTTVSSGSISIKNLTTGTAGLTLGGGPAASVASVTIQTGGTLTLGGDVTYSATNNPNGATISAAGTGVVGLFGNRSFAVGDSTAAPFDLTVSAPLQNGDATARNVSKSGAGTLLLTGNNTFTGATTIAANGGVLNAGAAGALGLTTSITVNNAGTLALSGSGNLNRINNSAAINLAGGTFLRSGAGTVSEGAGATRNGATVTGMSGLGLGALTLMSNSSLDFGTGGVGTFTFSSFVPGTSILNILNYTSSANFLGNVSGTDGTDDRLIFNQDQSTRLAFFSFNGVPAGEIALDGGFFEIVPVPEPGTWIAGSLVVAFVGWTQRRRLMGLVGRRA